MEYMIQYLTYALTTVGILAFVTSVITQVIKDMPGLSKIPTNLVAMVTALILCPLVIVIYCTVTKTGLAWYYIAGAVIGSFIVYLVATGGWERVHEIWTRTKYENKEE